jgi:biopolymer transport protein TolR
MNLVPYIDVMLVLLIIFMITAPLLTQGVHVSLPKAHAKPMLMQKHSPLVITVNREGHYFVNTVGHGKSIVSGAQLTHAVKVGLKGNPKRRVYVKGSRSVDYGKVVKVMALLQSAGAKAVGLVTDGLGKRD